MILRQAYDTGFACALAQQGLEKTAGAPKNLALAALISSGAVGGARAGGVFLSKAMHEKPSADFSEMLWKRREAGKFVNAEDFLRKLTPDVRVGTPRELAFHTVTKLKAEGVIPKSLETKRIANEWLTSSMYKEYKDGVNAGFTPGLGVISGVFSDPSVLAHEAAGHGRQGIKDPDKLRSFSSTLLGTEVKIEQDAWDRARKVFDVDPTVEEASMRTYRKAHAGAVGGAVGGAGLGAGAVGGLLLAASSLARKRKR